MRKIVRVRWARLAAVVLAITCVVLASERREQARRLAGAEAARAAEVARVKQLSRRLRECELVLHYLEDDEVTYERLRRSDPADR